MATIPKKAMLLVHHDANGKLWTLYRSDDGPVPFGLKFELRAPTGLAAALRSIASDLRENEPSTHGGLTIARGRSSTKIRVANSRSWLSLTTEQAVHLADQFDTAALEFDAQSAHDEARQARKRVVNVILAERDRQDQKWGSHNLGAVPVLAKHRDGRVLSNAEYGLTTAKGAQVFEQSMRAHGAQSGLAALVEEVCELGEAAAEDACSVDGADEPRTERELIQVAAYAFKMLEALYQRRAAREASKG